MLSSSAGYQRSYDFAFLTSLVPVDGGRGSTSANPNRARCFCQVLALIAEPSRLGCVRLKASKDCKERRVKGTCNPKADVEVLPSVREKRHRGSFHATTVGYASETGISFVGYAIRLMQTSLKVNSASMKSSQSYPVQTCTSASSSSSATIQHTASKVIQ